MAAAAEVSGFALLFIAGVMPVACRVQFTSKYGGRDVVALLGSSANFTWNFTGEMRVVDWGTKSPTSDDIGTKLVEIRRSGSGSASPPLQYAGRVNGSWDGKISPGQVIITLNLIRKEDERFYSCLILPVNILDQGDDDTFKLVVKDPVKASLDQSVIPAEIGTTARLQCNFTGIPTPNIAWIRRNQPNDIMVIKNSSKYELTSTSATISELAIKDVSLEDHGYYVCNASGFGYDVAQGFVGVPFFETVIPSGRVITIESPIGAPYLLECPVRGFPPPEVTWTLPNGTTLPNRLTKTLSIDAALGNYTCSATSLDEEVSEHIFVIKEDVITVVFNIERGPPVVVSWNNVSGAAYYTLKLTGDDIKNDSFLGRAKGGKESREIPINSLQFEDGKKKEQVNIDVQVLAVDANYRLIAKGGPRIATVSGVRTLHASGVPLSVALVFILTFW